MMVSTAQCPTSSGETCILMGLMGAVECLFTTHPFEVMCPLSAVTTVQTDDSR